MIEAEVSMALFRPAVLLVWLAALACAQTITTFAGNGSPGYSGDGGPAPQAQINRVVGLAADSSGNVYLAEENNHRVRKVDKNGIITTFAGTGSAGFAGDGGPASQAQLNTPLGVCADLQGNVYVNDFGNKRIRKITASGTISTIFGTGSNANSGDGGLATQASGVIPIRCATDRAGNVYFVDQSAHRVRKITVETGIVTTVGGNGTQGFSGDGGSATSASLNNPTAIATDSDGNLFFSDQFNHRVRRIDTNGVIQTVAFSGANTYGGDGGPATSASASFPGSLVLDSAGNIYIVDTAANRIRKVSGGIITTVAGTGSAGFSGDGGLATDAALNGPFAIAIDPAGSLYVGDLVNNRVRRISNNAGGAPAVQSASVTNAASFQTGVSPGAIITIFGQALGAKPGEVIAAPGTSWATSLSGVSVTMDGVAVPVYRILNLNGQEQVSVQAPYSLAGKNSVSVVVSTSSGSSAPVSVAVFGAQPGIFLLDAASSGAVHADGSVVTSAKPAAKGETVVVYLTGLGPVGNAPQPGQPASFSTLSPALITPQVVIGGFNAPVAFAGLTPGFIGLYQVNVVVPNAVPAGTVDLTVEANSIRSNVGKISIQ